MLYLIGATALSHFRLERLLTQICYVVPQVSELQAKFVHFLDLESPLNLPQQEILTSLLDYGQFSEPIAIPQVPLPPLGTLLLVIPRPGTVSPWSSKATEIVHHCNLQNIRRLERGIAYYLEANEKLTWGDIQAIGDILHDRMTEIVLYNFDDAKCLFAERLAKTLKTIPLLEQGRYALKEANTKLGLALSEEEIEYLQQSFQAINRDPTDVELRMFAELNSEHCRHNIFNAQWIINGVFKSQSLFDMIKNTYEVNARGILSAYSDNAAVMLGGESIPFYSNPETHCYQNQPELIHTVMKVETHNHPTAISPQPGAATGVGAEMRDEAATGRGGKPKAGMVGYCLSNLDIPGFLQPWELPFGKPKELAYPLDIILEAPIGAAQFGNEFGRPTLLGYFRTFEQRLPTQSKEDIWGYHKPIMIAGGMAAIRHMNSLKGTATAGDLVIVIGGPSMLIGLEGEAVTPMMTGTRNERLDFDLVQRGDAEMQRRCQEVIETCIGFGKNNPIISIQDVGAGGLANALSELVYQQDIGGHFELRDIPTIDTSLSPLELWCNEAQERYVIVVSETQFDIFRHIAIRESCPFAIIGHMIEAPKIECHDALNGSMPVNVTTEFLFDNVPRQRIENNRLPTILPRFSLDSIDISDAVSRLLRLPAIADKSFLITINDRTVTGLAARDPMVGPWQVPVADCAVSARDYIGYQGEAISLGERPMLALIDPKASSRMSVGEAITNIASACIGVLSDVRLSANWMAACEYEDENIKLYEAVQAIALELCPALNITIPVGKDSLAMQTIWQEGEETKRVISPASVVITAFAPVMDVRRTLTPELHTDCGDTQLIFIDLARGKTRLGGSALAQVYQQIGNNCPDVEDPEILKNFFSAIQQLNLEDKILAYHDRSDGGLFVTLCEMAFAGNTGLQIDLTQLGNDPKSILFNEELGVVIQVHSEDVDAVLLQLNDADLTECHVIGTLDDSDQLFFVYDDQLVYKEDRRQLEKMWSETSFHIQSLRDNPRTAKKQYDTITDKEDPGLNDYLTFDIKEDVSRDFIQVLERPKVAILREQGTNGHMEMAAAFHKAGFTAIDVHMNDLQQNTLTLEAMSGLAFCSGFSFGDALGAGQGWAKRILFNESLRQQFETFFNRTNTFTLGIANGCQVLASLKDIIPGAEHWPSFVRNYSEQFESRLCMVEVESSSSMLFKGMEGSRLLVPVAHAEGRTEFLDENAQDAMLKQQFVTLRYVDSRGRKTNLYPANPNGSALGITGLTNSDGRINIMMPHPERAFRTIQYSWHPKGWGEDAPWLRMFRNARVWVG